MNTLACRRVVSWLFLRCLLWAFWALLWGSSSSVSQICFQLSASFSFKSYDYLFLPCFFPVSSLSHLFSQLPHLPVVRDCVDLCVFHPISQLPLQSRLLFQRLSQSEAWTTKPAKAPFCHLQTHVVHVVRGILLCQLPNCSGLCSPGGWIFQLLNLNWKAANWHLFVTPRIARSTSFDDLMVFGDIQNHSKIWCGWNGSIAFCQFQLAV